MAVRRISELPELYTTYPNATAKKCLIEVSYNHNDKVYQSFYVKATDLLNVSVGDALPHATNNSYGVVKIASNGGIINTEGILSVPLATETTPGLVTIPQTAEYVLIDNGKLKAGRIPTSLTVTAGAYEIIDTAYPIGSLYMTVLSDGQPPGCTNSIGDGDLINGSINADGTKQMQWERLSDDMSIWSDSTHAGQAISGQLPALTNELSVQVAGQHQHGLKFTSGAGGGWGTSKCVTGLSKPDTLAKANVKTNVVAAHTHQLVVSNDASGAYVRNDNIVRPTSIGVIMWQRLPDIKLGPANQQP